MPGSRERLNRLRKKVEESKRLHGDAASSSEADDMSELIEELETYQVELVQANQELRETQLRLVLCQTNS